MREVTAADMLLVFTVSLLMHNKLHSCS